METRKGLLTKLGIFTAVAVLLFVVSKKHIAAVKEDRHRLESDSSVDNPDTMEFTSVSARPGFPTNNPNLNYEGQGRESRYVGAGNSYSSRTPGDRLGFWNVFWSNGKDD